MKLTNFTDIGLRALMRIASRPEQVHSTSDISEEFNISRHHLTKAMAVLASAGYIDTRRGSGGGARLLKPADKVLLGDVIQLLEQNTSLVECFDVDGGSCIITPQCKLKGMLANARLQFIEYMNGHTLADCALDPYSFLMVDETL